MLLALSLFAQQPAAGEASGAPFWMSMMPILFIVLIGYFLLLRPAQVQEKRRQALVQNLKKNDKIENSGGILGIVDSVKDDEVLLKGGMRVTKRSVVRVIAADDGKESKDGGA